MTTAQVGAALGGFAAVAGLERERERERAAALRLRNEIWWVLTAVDEEEEPAVAPQTPPQPPPKPVDPELPTKEMFEAEKDEL